MTTSHHNKKESYLFNPFEIFFSGFSGSGKTTLIEKLVKNLSDKYSIGYVKHDAHKFDMDYEGKDTFKLYNAGSNQVLINDKDHFALIGKASENSKSSLDFVLQKKNLLNSDFVFVEGYKYNPYPKIVIIDEKEEILKDFEDGKVTNVIAFVGIEKIYEKDLIPYFNRDDIDRISNFIISYFEEKFLTLPIYGLVLAGGQSSRMKTNKADLIYHGKSQLEHSCDLLSKFCDKVFISSREEQNYISNYEKIHDTFLNIGPMGGILSALTFLPKSSFLVLACDMPYITEESIKKLIKERNPFKFATSYINLENNFPEPLCTIYEPKSKSRLLDFLSMDYSCPRKVLINSEVKLVKPENNIEMSNINHPEEYQETLVKLEKSKK